MISKSKALEILHDGTIRGKKITDAQRRFFGAMSNKAFGGELPIIHSHGGGVYSMGGKEYSNGGQLEKLKKFFTIKGGPTQIGFKESLERSMKHVSIDDYRKALNSPLGAVYKAIDPTGLSSWPDVAKSWQDSTFNSDDITQPLSAIPMLGKIPKVLNYFKKSADAAGFAQDIINSRKTFFTGGAMVNFMRNNLSELNSPVQNTNQPQSFQDGGRETFLPGQPGYLGNGNLQPSMNTGLPQIMPKAELATNYAFKNFNPRVSGLSMDRVGTGLDLANMAAEPFASKGPVGSGISGALKGAQAGAALGPIGMGVGAVIGGVSGVVGGNKQAEAEQLQEIIKKREELGSATKNISPQAHIYNYGGMKYEMGAMIRNKYSGENPSGRYLAKGGDVIPRLTEFNEGGSHEQNPDGGVRQGVGGPNGEPNLVEQGETKFKNYIYSDRLKLNNPKEYNLGGNLTGKSFASISKKLSKMVEDRPNDPIAKGSQDKMLERLRQANDDAIEMKKFEEQSQQFNMGGKMGYCMPPTQIRGQFKYGGYIFKDI